MRLSPSVEWPQGRQIDAAGLGRPPGRPGPLRRFWAASCASGGKTPFNKAGLLVPTVHPKGAPERALPIPASAGVKASSILARTP